MKRPKYHLEIVKRIEDMKCGSVFTAVDFLDIADTDPVNKALSRLYEEGKIRRIIQGVYDKPEYSDFLKEYGAPQVDKVADALARKFNWTIAPSGDVALNMLHISTQVPNVWEYISDGPNKEYKIGNKTLKFKKTANKNVSGYSMVTQLTIQAIKAIGKDNMTNQDISLFQNNLTDEEKMIILMEGKKTAAWIYQYMRVICERRDDSV